MKNTIINFLRKYDRQISVTIYSVVILIGFLYVFLEIRNGENSIYVKMDVFVRACIFILGFIIPLIMWQERFSHFFISHERIVSTRLEISRLRNNVFRQRKKYYLISIMISLSTAVFSITVFGSNNLGEIVILSFLICATLVSIYFMAYLSSDKFVVNSFKRLKNFMIPVDEYRPQYGQNSIIDRANTSYTNNEEKKTTTKTTTSIDPDTIFRTNMYEKFLSLEERLISEKYLDNQLCWLPTHPNNTPNIRKLIIFIMGLIDNTYFLPKRNPQIRQFFEDRYSIEIGQNLEPSRCKNLRKEYLNIFYDYKF